MNSQEERLISRRELAERWGISTESCKRYEQRGILKPVKLAPRLLRYPLSQILEIEREATLDRREVKA